MSDLTPLDKARRRLERDLERDAEVRADIACVFTADLRLLLDAEREARAECERLREALSAGEASDGYHTHRELYEYRMLYHAHAARGWLTDGIPVVKSWFHSDGAPCFGGGWFIVVAELPTGQVSNHYRAEHWTLFDVPAVELPPEYDGHSPADAADRLRAFAEPPADAQDDYEQYVQKHEGGSMTGIERIAAERQRQIEKEGWTPDHDDEHDDEALAMCAAIYATPEDRRSYHVAFLSGLQLPRGWPLDACDWKPGDRIRELEKAGALIAAEIDRLLRLREGA